MLEIATSYVLNDEPALGLSEVNLVSPETHQWHRYQIIRVVRDDKVAEYREDMGPSKNFTDCQRLIPGGAIDPSTKKMYIEETVGSLRTYSQQMKDKPTINVAELVKSNDRRIV